MAVRPRIRGQPRRRLLLRGRRSLKTAKGRNERRLRTKRTFRGKTKRTRAMRKKATRGKLNGVMRGRVRRRRRTGLTLARGSKGMREAVRRKRTLSEVWDLRRRLRIKGRSSKRRRKKSRRRRRRTRRRYSRQLQRPSPPPALPLLLAGRRSFLLPLQRLWCDTAPQVFLRRFRFVSQPWSRS